MAGRRPAIGVGEGRVGHAQLLCALCHQLRKTGFGSIWAKRFSNHGAGIIAGQHNDPSDQVFDADTVCGVQKHGRATIRHCVAADGKPFIQRQPTIADRFKGHVKRHELGHRRRRQAFVGVLGQKNCPRGLVQHKGRTGRGIKGDRRDGRVHPYQQRSGQQTKGR